MIRPPNTLFLATVHKSKTWKLVLVDFMFAEDCYVLYFENQQPRTFLNAGGEVSERDFFLSPIRIKTHLIDAKPVEVARWCLGVVQGELDEAIRCVK